MTANVLILPIIRREAEADNESGHLVQFKCGRLDYARLKNRAAEWGLSEGEAALAILSEALKPKRRRE